MCIIRYNQLITEFPIPWFFLETKALPACWWNADREIPGKGTALCFEKFNSLSNVSFCKNLVGQLITFLILISLMVFDNLLLSLSLW